MQAQRKGAVQPLLQRPGARPQGQKEGGEETIQGPHRQDQAGQEGIEEGGRVAHFPRSAGVAPYSHRYRPQRLEQPHQLE